jgi:hypothetical protein
MFALVVEGLSQVLRANKIFAYSISPNLADICD